MVSNKTKIKRYRELWQMEVDSAAQYRALSDIQTSASLARIFKKLSAIEEAHAHFWEERLRQCGVTLGPMRPSWRAKVLIFIARHINPQLIIPTMAAAERAGHRSYAQQTETMGTTMASQEAWHARILGEILKSPHGSAVTGGAFGRIEGRHRASGGNTLRAAVLGANDGLCSNLSLVMGVAGATTDRQAVLIAGIAGLLAGAFSMALGEFISMISSQEWAERELRIEAEELAVDPAGEAAELRLIYEAKGLSEADARHIADQLLADPKHALDTLAREELGIDPDEMGGSPWLAAGMSFVLFAMGAIIPIIPFLVLNPATAVISSIAISAAALFGIGAAITIFTGRSVWLSGTRQLSLGMLAASLTYAIGHFVGANL